MTELADRPPPLAHIEHLSWEQRTPCGEHQFRIESSEADPNGLVFISPDAATCSECLAELLDPKVFKVNLIPYNPTGMYEGSSRKAIAAFKDVLDAARLPATVRLTRGRDIAAACGQLAAAPKPRAPKIHAPA